MNDHRTRATAARAIVPARATAADDENARVQRLLRGEGRSGRRVGEDMDVIVAILKDDIAARR